MTESLRPVTGSPPPEELLSVTRPRMLTAPVSAAPALLADVPDFVPGGEFTVGAEDELLLVDEDGRLLGAQAAPLMASLQAQTVVDGTLMGEVYVDEVELGTPVCDNAEDLASSLGRLRRRLTRSGAHLMAVGVHPEAELGTAITNSSSRYDRIVDEYAGLFRTPTAAFQVHVGMPDPQTALLAYRGLRNRLSLLRALAAGSPYWHGQDSGLASARTAITRSYPRTTVPPVLHSWDHYRQVTRLIMSAAEVPDYTYVWWDLRPQPRLGTLEVRVMDAQPSLDRIAGLTALAQGIALHATEVPDRDDLPDEVLAANDFRACRYGLDTRIVDLDGSMVPLRELAARAVAEARAVLAEDGRDRPLEVIESMLRETPEPYRQRGIVTQHGMAALRADLLARTCDPDC